MSEYKSNEALDEQRIATGFIKWCKSNGRPAPSDAQIAEAVKWKKRQLVETAVGEDSHGDSSPNDNARVTPRSLPNGDCKHRAEQLPLFDHGKASSQTRAAAARESIKSKDAWKEKCLSFLESRGWHGAIADEMAAAFEVDNCCLTSALLELRDEGRVFVTNRKRPTRRGKNAAVMVAIRFVDRSKEATR